MKQVQAPVHKQALKQLLKKRDFRQGHREELDKLRARPSHDPFTETEWITIEQLAAQPPVAIRKSAGDSRRYLKQHLGTRG
jgi:hypothetical protein